MLLTCQPRGTPEAAEDFRGWIRYECVNYPFCNLSLSGLPYHAMHKSHVDRNGTIFNSIAVPVGSLDGLVIGTIFFVRCVASDTFIRLL